MSKDLLHEWVVQERKKVFVNAILEPEEEPVQPDHRNLRAGQIVHAWRVP